MKKTIAMFGCAAFSVLFLVCGKDISAFSAAALVILQCRTVKKKRLVMLSKWTEVLPLFVVRWLAVRICERGFIFREENERIVAFARPDVMFKIWESKGD